MADEPILELTTLVRRPKIAIDGERYEIRSPDELSVLDHQRLASLGTRLQKLMDKAELTTPEEKELGELIPTISAKIMVGVPIAIAARLSDEQRLKVIEVFTSLLPEQLAGLVEAINRQAQRRTGESSAHGSSVSTAARRERGSKKRRSQSSGAAS